MDVRSPEEHKQSRDKVPRVNFVPLGVLRCRTQEIPEDKKIVTL